MNIFAKLEKITDKIKMVENLMSQTETIKSSRVDRIFKGIHSMEKANSAVKQAQQVQSLMQTTKGRKLQNNPADILPFLLFLLNNLPVINTNTEEIR
jgi:signal recognition particle GTPase